MSDGERRPPPTVVGGAGVRVGQVLGVPIVIQPIWFLIVCLFSIGFKPTVQDRVPTLADGPSYLVALTFVL